MGWSVELCGGTHVARTGDIGLIAGLSDSAVAAGVRRIEAVTGTTARKYAHHLGELAKAASAELKVPLEEMPARLAQVLDERRRLERELSEAKKKLAMGGGARAGAAEGADGVRVVGDVKLMARVVEGIEIKDLKQPRRRGQETTRLRRRRPRRHHRGRQGQHRRRRDRRSRRAVLGRRSGAQGLPRCLGGKGGGGKPDMAQAGGPDGSKAEAALEGDRGRARRRVGLARVGWAVRASTAHVLSTGYGRAHSALPRGQNRARRAHRKVRQAILPHLVRSLERDGNRDSRGPPPCRDGIGARVSGGGATRSSSSGRSAIARACSSTACSSCSSSSTWSRSRSSRCRS